MLTCFWVTGGSTENDPRYSTVSIGACAAGIAHGMVNASYALPELWLVWILGVDAPTRRRSSLKARAIASQ